MRHNAKFLEALDKAIADQGLLATFRDGCLWPEPYATDSYESCLAFVYVCKTFNEANRGTDPILPKAYIDWAVWHWYDTRRVGQPLITWKSRRMVYSWLSRCLELWDAGLKVASTQLAAKKYEGDSGSQAFIWRYWKIYEELRRDFPKWNLPRSIPGGNPQRFQLENLILDNGSKFEAINSEKESFRGSGATRAISEELSSYANVNAVWGQQNFVCQGKPDEVGGHVVAIANTSANDQWMELKAPAWTDPSWPQPPMGCEVWETAGGVRVLKIHYSADPEKDAVWVEKTRRGIPAEEWDQEMELDEDIEEGLPVYPSYDDDTHCIRKFRRERIPVVSGAIFVGAWDCGQTLIPAFALFQITPEEKQVHMLYEVISSGNESMAQFAPRVSQGLQTHFSDVMDQIIHCGDATVTTPSGTDRRSARDEARRWGFNIRPLPNEFEFRRSSGNKLLARVIDDGKPGFLIDGMMCPIARKALKGKYKYEFAKSDAGKEQEARTVLRPKKNAYSHIGDAFGYGSGMIMKIIDGKLGRSTPKQGIRPITKRTINKDPNSKYDYSTP